MSGTTSVQNPPEIIKNPTQDLQESVTFHGRVFHKISDGGKYIIQSINNVAQSVLSQCIYVISFGCYNLDSLKSYLFPNQTALKDDKTASSNNLSTPGESSPSNSAPLPSVPPLANSPPPPPREPTKEDLNGVSPSRFSSTKMQEPITAVALNKTSDVRSSINSTQDVPKEDDYTLEDGTNSRRSSLYEDLNPVIEEQSNNNPDVSPQKKKNGIQKKIKQGKQAAEVLFAGIQNNPLFQKKQKEVNQE